MKLFHVEQVSDLPLSTPSLKKSDLRPRASPPSVPQSSRHHGEVAEWSIAAVLKTAGRQGLGVRIPPSSANFSPLRSKNPKLGCPVDVGNLDMNQPTISVNRFENRNGVVSCRVDGRLNGVRIRRNFKTQEEAAAEKSTLELKALQMAKDLRTVATDLTAEQVHDAETAFRRIAGQPQSLLFYLEFALAHFR